MARQRGRQQQVEKAEPSAAKERAAEREGAARRAAMERETPGLKDLLADRDRVFEENAAELPRMLEREQRQAQVTRETAKNAARERQTGEKE
jgi:hypothetical protein